MPLFFSAPGVGVSMAEVGVSMGPARFANPPDHCPRIPSDDVKCPPNFRL